MIDKLVEEMREEALQKKFTFDSLSDKSTFAGASEGIRIFEIDGIEASVKLTFDKFSEDVQCWHLSISPRNVPVVPDAVVDKIKERFFADGEKVLEFPSILFPGKVRQFIHLADRGEEEF